MAYPYTSSFASKTPMDKIYDIFRDHWTALYDQKRKTCQAIEDWGRDLTQQIREHVAEQERLVEQAYEKQQKHLDDMRDDFVATSRISERNNNTQEIDQLLDTCRTLKVELVQLSFYSVDNQYIQVVPVEPLQQMGPEGLSSNKNGGDKFDQRSTHKSTTDTAFDKGFKSDSYSPSTSATSSSANQHLTTQSSKNYSSAVSTNNSKPEITSDDTSGGKCPICLMIFPSYMNENSRIQHVDEHYKDD